MTSNQSSASVVVKVVGFMSMLAISGLSASSAYSSQSMDPVTACILIATSLALIGGILGLIERSLQGRPVGERPVLHTVFNDLRIRHFSTIGIVSTIYSVIYGSCIGLSISGLGIATLLYNKTYNVSYAVFVIICSIALILCIFLFRILAESYVVVFKVAQKYLNGVKD